MSDGNMNLDYSIIYQLWAVAYICMYDTSRPSMYYL